jgi:hypothetical protein
MRVRSAVAAALFASASMVCAPVEARRCDMDTVMFAGFETISGVRLAGLVGGLESGQVEVRVLGQVLVQGQVGAGTYQLDLPALAPEVMLEVRVRGEGDQSFIELASFVGTAGQLRDAANADGITRVGRVATLAVSPESTARYSLILAALSGERPPSHECELARLSAELDSEELIRRAAVIQILSSASFSGAAGRAKTGSPTTLDILLDPDLLEETVENIETHQPGLLAATMNTLSTPFCDFFADEALLVQKERLERVWMNVFSGQSYETLGPTNGRHTNFAGSDGYTFDCSGDGFEATLAGDRVEVFFPVRIVNGQPIQVRAERVVTRSVLTRVQSFADLVVVADYREGMIHFPENPSLPSEASDSESRQVLILERTGSAFTAGNTPGEYLLPTGILFGDQSANRVRLDDEGEGEDLDAATPLSWEVTDGGELLIDFEGRAARVIPLRDESPDVRDVLVVVEFDSGARSISQRLALRKTDVSGFWETQAAVPGKYLQVAGRALDSTFHWLLQGDRNAPGISTFDGEEFVNFIYAWSLEGPGEVVLRLCNFNPAQPILDREPVLGECTSSYRRRSWKLYSVHDDNYYVHEVQQFWFGVDPATGAPPTPSGLNFQRANFYQRLPLL